MTWRLSWPGPSPLDIRGQAASLRISSVGTVPGPKVWADPEPDLKVRFPDGDGVSWLRAAIPFLVPGC